MPRRVLLTGAAGLLGTWLQRTMPAGIEVVALLHRRPAQAGSRPSAVRADLRSAAAADEAVVTAAPDLVLHAAYADDEDSIVHATEHVAAATVRAGADLLHVSTDAVFSGDGRPRSEGDAPDPIADYGRWKLRSEQAATAHLPDAAIVRLPLVVSLDPEDAAVARIRRAAAEADTTRWFDDEIRQPARADELAEAIWAIVGLEPQERSGVWHLPGPERLSRLEIALRARATLGLPPTVVTGGPTPEGLVRPRDLHLLDDRARRTIGWSPAAIFG
jgi:dTDP-4-dehydrorhamnose reductase